MYNIYTNIVHTQSCSHRVAHAPVDDIHSTHHDRQGVARFLEADGPPGRGERMLTPESQLRDHVSVRVVEFGSRGRLQVVRLSKVRGQCVSAIVLNCGPVRKKTYNVHMHLHVYRHSIRCLNTNTTQRKSKGSYFQLAVSDTT